MANSITRTYDIRVFRQQFDDNGAVTAITVDPELSFQVNTDSKEVVDFVCMACIADSNQVNINNSDINELAADMSRAMRGVIIETKVINPTL